MGSSVCPGLGDDFWAALTSGFPRFWARGRLPYRPQKLSRWLGVASGSAASGVSLCWTRAVCAARAPDVISSRHVSGGVSPARGCSLRASLSVAVHAARGMGHRMAPDPMRDGLADL